MSDYLANLNNPTAPIELGNDLDDTALFTNTDFFNFDFGDPSSAVSVDSSNDNNSSSRGLQSWNRSSPSDFLSHDNFQFNPSNLLSGPNGSTGPTANSFPDLISLPQTQPTSSSSAKRKSHNLEDPQLTLEERTRFAAEEDKRRRNTAASARFRVKKKQREQALEKSAKEASDKVLRLESRVKELEMENRWLKSLITEQDGGDSDLSEAFAKFKEKVEEGGLDALSALISEK
jgi:hypothetical protein